MRLWQSPLRPCPYLHSKPASQNPRMDWKLVTFEHEGASPQEGISSNPHPFLSVFQAFALRAAACRRSQAEAWTSVKTGLWRKEAGCHTLGLSISLAPERVWPLFTVLIHLVSPLPAPHCASLSALPGCPDWLAIQGLLGEAY